MAKRSYQLEGVTKLKSSLLLTPDFLGLWKPAEIGGVEVKVGIPDFEFLGEDDFDPFKPRLPGRFKANWIDYYSKHPAREWEPFGRPTKWHRAKPNGGIEEFEAIRLLLLSKHEITEHKAKQLLREVDEWLARLDIWIEVFTRWNLRRRGSESDQRGTYTDLWLQRAGPKKRGKEVRKEQRPISLFAFPPLPLKPPQWGKLLAKASSGEMPPASHLFLRDARRELDNRRYRRGVLDAATAAEIALTTLRDDRLAIDAPTFSPYVQVKSRQLSGLVEVLKSIGCSLPSNIQQEIAEPRNKAIHEGQEPSEEAAKKCLRKAGEVVNLVFPWKKLLD